jgi:hypothetical protein
MRLEYLAAPAERYGTLQFDDPVFDFLENRMTPEEAKMLSELANRWGQDDEVIEAWLDKYRITEHEESRLVYFLGYLISQGRDNGFIK